MAKRNKKGGWTGGSSVNHNGKNRGAGPQVEKNRSELAKYNAKRSPLQKALLLILFVLVCVLIGSLVYQATPKNVAEYWGLEEQKDAISSVEINVYTEEGDKETTTFTEAADLEAFYAVLDETEVERLWFADEEVAAFTSDIRIYVNGEKTPAFEVGFVEERVYFLNMSTYDWYLPEGAPLLEYLK